MECAISARIEVPAAQGYRHQRRNWDIELGALWQRLRGIACRMDLIGTLSEDALRVQRRESLPQVGYDGLGSRNGYRVDTQRLP